MGLEIRTSVHTGTEASKMELILELKEVPPSTNNVWKYMVRGHRVMKYTSAEGKKFKELVRSSVPHIHMPFEGRIKADISLTFPTRRKCDIDNFNKVLLDALNGIAYVDDSQIVELKIKKFYSKNKPKTILRLTETHLKQNYKDFDVMGTTTRPCEFCNTVTTIKVCSDKETGEVFKACDDCLENMRKTK